MCWGALELGGVALLQWCWGDFLDVGVRCRTTSYKSLEKPPEEIVYL